MARTASVLIGVAFLLSWNVLSGSAAETISAKRTLGSVIPNVKLENIALSDAMEYLRDVSNANLHVNWKALEGAGVGKDAQINIRLRNVSFRKTLDLILSEAGAGTALTYFIDQGVIEVTTRELADKDMITRIYPIDDLLVEIPDFAGPDINITSANTGGGGRGGGGGGGGGSLFGGGGSGGGGANGNIRNQQPMTRDERAQQIVDTIINVVQPDIWQANGGRAAIRFFNGSLVVTAPRSVHEALGYYND